jgi:hypothetical protein
MVEMVLIHHAANENSKGFCMHFAIEPFNPWTPSVLILRRTYEKIV